MLIIPLDTASSSPIQPNEPSMRPMIPANNVPPINTIMTFTPNNANTNTKIYGTTLIRL